jgi:hypothetical protein
MYASCELIDLIFPSFSFSRFGKSWLGFIVAIVDGTSELVGEEMGVEGNWGSF